MNFRIPCRSPLLAALLIVFGARAQPPADDAATLRTAIAAERARPIAVRMPRAAFLAQPQVQAVRLSPDGRQLAWIRERGGKRGVWLQSLPAGRPRLMLPRTEASDLDWSHDSRWLLLAEPRQLAAIAADGQRGAGRVTELEGVSRRRFLWVDDSAPAAVLVLERPAGTTGSDGRWRLLRIAVDGEQTVLHEDSRPIVGAAIGENGTLAWLLLAEGDAHLLFRGADLAQGRPQLRCAQLRRCGLLGAAPDGGVWMSSNSDSDRTALVHLGADGQLQHLQDDPRGEADVSEVSLDPVDGRPRLVGYRSTVPQLVALEDADARRLASIQRRLPHRSLRVQLGVARWLVSESSDTLRGERWWLAEADGALTEVLADAGFTFEARPQPRPDETQMARKWPIRWPASDGRLLHGFVTLPSGVDVAKAPLVVSVHGGPFGQARPDFSNDAQLLANRGYVVFQPNFRGSTGLGREYLFAAHGDFGNGRVQQDIVEGTRWLLANGIGDRARVGIIGASFGGYSALLGVTFQPELFQVAVAGVPPVDFGWVMRQYLGSGHQMFPGIPMASSMRALGLDPADAALAKKLADQSPATSAGALRRPVLIVAGGQDERVPIRGITHYTALLRTLNKDVSLFVDDQADHGIADEHSREAYYFLMETMLHRRLGGAEPEPASAALRRHLQRHLQLRGTDLADQ